MKRLPATIESLLPELSGEGLEGLSPTIRPWKTTRDQASQSMQQVIGGAPSLAESFGLPKQFFFC